MRPELLERGVVKRLGRGLLDRPVHPLDLAVGPRMEGFGQAMFDTVPLAERIERMRPVSLGAWLLGELDAVVGQNLWTRYGKAFRVDCRKSTAVLRVACVHSPAWTNLLVRSIATKR